MARGGRVGLERELDEITRTQPPERLGDRFGTGPEFGPTGGRQHENRECAPFEILLLAEALVGRHQRVKGLLGGGEQVAVGKLAPTHFGRGLDLVPGQRAAKRQGRALVKEHSHATRLFSA